MAQTVVVSYAHLWPIFSIYYFCLFRYQAFLKFYDYLAARFKQHPTWLLWLCVMLLLAGLPAFISCIMEIVYPSRSGTMRMAGLDDGLVRKLFSACMFAGFSAVPGFAIYCYVTLIDLTIVRVIYRFLHKLSSKFREAVVLLTAAGVFFLVVTIGKIGLSYLR